MKVKTLLSMLAVVLAVFAVNAQEMSVEDIKKRIKPTGNLHIAGAVAASAGAAAAGPRSGADIYNSACSACHTSGVLGAPKLHAAADWKPRLDDRGLDGVWKNALNGINAMPPRGTCGNCSDEDIKSAIEYMIEGV